MNHHPTCSAGSTWGRCRARDIRALVACSPARCVVCADEATTSAWVAEAVAQAAAAEAAAAEATAKATASGDGKPSGGRKAKPATTASTMGKAMALLMAAHRGEVDGKLAQRLLKEALG